MEKLIKKYNGEIWINGNDEVNVTFKLQDFKKLMEELNE